MAHVCDASVVGGGESSQPNGTHLAKSNPISGTDDMASVEEAKCASGECSFSFAPVPDGSVAATAEDKASKEISTIDKTTKNESIPVSAFPRKPNVSPAQKIMTAIAANDPKAVRELSADLSREDLEETNCNGETMIIVAAKARKCDVLDVIVEVAPPECLLLSCVEGRSALSWAAMHGDVDMLNKLLDKVCSEPAALNDDWRWKKDMESPVHAAVIGGNEDCMRALVKHCNVHQLTSSDARGRTPLMLCAEVDPECTMARVLIDALPVECLLDRTSHCVTATVQQRTGSSENSFVGKRSTTSALEYAIQMGNEQLVGLIIGAAPIQHLVHVDDDGWSHFNTACLIGNVAFVQRLAYLVPGMIEAAHRRPPCALGIAAEHGHAEIVDFLLLFVKPFASVSPYERALACHCPALLAAQNGHDGIAVKLVNELPCLAVKASELLCEGFKREDPTLLNALIEVLPQNCSISLNLFEEHLATAPPRNFEIIMNAFPELRRTIIRQFGNISCPMDLKNFKGVLRLVLEHDWPGATVSIQELLFYAVRTNQTDHFIFGLEEIQSGKNGLDVQFSVLAHCIFQNSPKFLLLCVELFPRHMWSGELSSTCACAAVRRGNPECVRVLLDTLPRDAWVEQQRSPLLVCMRNKFSLEVYEMLLEHMSEEELMTPVERSGWTPIHFAAQRGPEVFIPLAEKLSEESLLAQTKDGRTPLHIAAEEDCIDNAIWLMQHLPQRAKSIRDDRGRTPADVAQTKERAAILTPRPKAALVNQ